MKKDFPVVATTAILMCMFFSCSHHRRHNNSIDISISESHDIYKLQAAYNEDKTGEVQGYINRQIEPNRLFSSTEDYFDANTELKDRTKFYIKSSPGKLMIKLNKRENSYASCARIKNMCEGIAGILKEK